MLVIFGSEGNIGRRLRRAWPDAVGIDRKAGADIIADLDDCDFVDGAVGETLSQAEAVIWLATSADPEAPAAVHLKAVSTVSRFICACRTLGVPRLVLPSSDWADPPPGGPTINAYGYSKRAIEALAAMYCATHGRTAVALRIGFVPEEGMDLAGLPPEILAGTWSDARLVAEMTGALDWPSGATE